MVVKRFDPKKPIIPKVSPEIPRPENIPEKIPPVDPEEPIWPIEEPDDFPEEDPYETPPFEIPPPGEGP